MHSYLKAVGFSKVTKRSEMQEIIRDVIETYDEKLAVENHPDGVFVEYSKNYGCDCGITVCGQYDDKNEFHVEYSFPFFRGTGITTQEKVVVERHAEKESYAGVCDELNIGVTMIFYLQNVADYLAETNSRFSAVHYGARLAGLSVEGKILCPILDKANKAKAGILNREQRNQLMAQAREGDEDAIESLTLEDMDTYALITKRIEKEDVLSIVKSTFMPFGIESDQYTILGEILDFTRLINKYTNETIYAMNIECNDIVFDICINEKDMLGEPAIGTRFKGNIWMQGSLCLE